MERKGQEPGKNAQRVDAGGVPQAPAGRVNLRNSLRLSQSGLRLSSGDLPALTQAGRLLVLEPSIGNREIRPAAFETPRDPALAGVVLPRLGLQPTKLFAATAPAAAASAVMVDEAVVVDENEARIEFSELVELQPVMHDEPIKPFAFGDGFASVEKDDPADFNPIMPGVERTPADSWAGADEGLNGFASLLANKSVIDNGAANEPLWQQLFSPGSEKEREERKPIPTLSDQRPSVILNSAVDWGQAGEIEFSDLRDSLADSADLEPIREPGPKRYWFWQRFETLFLSRAFSGALAAVVLALFVSSIDFSGKWWSEGSGQISQPISSAVNQVSQPIRERAAFFFVEDLSDGASDWTESAGLRVDPAGWMEISNGFTLYEKSEGLRDYDLTFDAKIQSNAAGWAVRAADENNFYGFKLVKSGSAQAPVYTLARFSMIDGVRKSLASGIEIPAALARADDFNRIRVLVAKDHVTTLVNGWGVDEWRDSQLARGGVGLLADAGESALIRDVSVTGNTDPWGMFLYGTVETMQSIQEFVGMGQAPAVIVFYRPIVGSPDRAFQLAGAR